ncbi:MAG: GDSL-type esterase/lipase family protein [Leptolyngbyaceae cyanobacterium bins.349]|nr:GDSL-type esterase/lipase family protein [Leptolyngbyaceae cyanobacterium bins.349]
MRTYLKAIAIPLARWLVPDTIRKLEQCQDWAQLSIYHQQNQELAPPAPGEDRVVFFGDSITEFWDLTTAFPGKPYINRGISGQTTSQMLLRFRADVVALKPKVVLILAGINDLAGNTGPMTLEMIEDNYTAIAQLAQINQIYVIFASVLPIHDYGVIRQSTFRPPTKILALNTWLQQYCAVHHHLYLDYHSAMVNEQGMLRAEWSDDGIHPNAEGYAVMTHLADAALQTCG